MADRQIHQLTTTSLAATDVFPFQDAAGAAEAVKATIQSLKEFVNGGKRITIRLSYSGSAVTADILENDFGVTISDASVFSNGNIAITFSSGFMTASKTLYNTSSVNAGGNPYFVIGQRFTTSYMFVSLYAQDGTQSGTPVFSDYIFNIIVYP